MTADIEYFKPNDIAELMRWSQSHLANLRCRDEGPPFIKVRNRVRVLPRYRGQLS